MRSLQTQPALVCVLFSYKERFCHAKIPSVCVFTSFCTSYSHITFCLLFLTLLHTCSVSNPATVYVCVLLNALQSDGQGSGASKNGTG